MITGEDTETPGASSPLWAGERHVLPEVAEIAGLPARQLQGAALPPAFGNVPARVRYVEDKRIDWQRVQEITTLSEGARQWANFGPVSLALERVLEQIMRLPVDRAVVMCASATVGLQALAALQALKFGRRLRWVVSAYTFFSQRTAPFSDAIVADCDHHGMIDLDAVGALPDDSWDGLVVTNLFAGLSSTRSFADFCRARGKALIVDSAGALLGPERGSPGLPVEAVSFHHTKPWGIGEGGCIIVDRADAPHARSTINFGVGGPDFLKPLAGNGKISDLACAFILERLERLPMWARNYATQRQRIEQLCAAARRPVLLRAPANAILANIPVLAEQPVERGQLVEFGFDVGKYYPPLSEAAPRARHLFAHIVNIPSHAGMAGIETAAIAALLRRLSLC